MRLCNVYRSFVAPGLLALAATALSAQANRRPISSPGPTRAVDLQAQQLWAAFSRAILDAAVYQPANLRPLRPLSPARDSVTVVTLATENDTVGTLKQAKWDGTWVTGEGEVRKICRNFRGDILLQLHQLLGMPPVIDTAQAARDARILVLRAKAADVFRPSPDPRIVTTYPCTKSGSAVPAECGNEFPARATTAHREWIVTASLNYHQLPDTVGYPWTHLGYTYNWAPGADRYGASEYVIRAGSFARVIANSSPSQYCAP